MRRVNERFKKKKKMNKKNILSGIILKGIRKKDEIGFKERKSGRE